MREREEERAAPVSASHQMPIFKCLFKPHVCPILKLSSYCMPRTPHSTIPPAWLPAGILEKAQVWSQTGTYLKLSFYLPSDFRQVT